ncbi:MAG TPA: aldo/keto reductase [Chloroflexota bacterium]|jgi:aryl-alcohol dehydrogenase-like predicted oxidoreductase|nr:aldo/keto reductase [Chloroflexota bacterium]
MVTTAAPSTPPTPTAGLRPLTARVPYGGTGLSVSRLCWGTGLMAALRHNLSLEEAARILWRGFELGVNFWDTADGYKSHPHVGHALRRLDREQVVINTKTPSKDAEGAAADVERYLRELDTAYLDIVLLHGVESVEELDRRAGALEALLRAKAAGKVRAVGLSTHLASGAIMEACAARPEIEVVLTTVNRTGQMLRQATLEAHLPLVRAIYDAGKAVCLMKTLAQGGLARTPDEVRQAIRYNLSLPYAHSVCVGVNSVAEVEFAVAAAS